MRHVCSQTANRPTSWTKLTRSSERVEGEAEEKTKGEMQEKKEQKGRNRRKTKRRGKPEEKQFSPFPRVFPCFSPRFRPFGFSSFPSLPSLFLFPSFSFSLFLSFPPFSGQETLFSSSRIF